MNGSGAGKHGRHLVVIIHVNFTTHIGGDLSDHLVAVHDGRILRRILAEVLEEDIVDARVNLMGEHAGKEYIGGGHVCKEGM